MTWSQDSDLHYKYLLTWLQNSDPQSIQAFTDFHYKLLQIFTDFHLQN